MGADSGPCRNVERLAYRIKNRLKKIAMSEILFIFFLVIKSKNIPIDNNIITMSFDNFENVIVVLNEET